MTTLVLEQTPLLLHIGDEHYDVTGSQTPEAENALETVQQDHSPFTSSRYGRQLCILIFLWEFSQYLVYAPLTAVFEDIICTRHYSKTTHCLPKDCKIVSMSNELAFLKVADFLPVCYYRSFPVGYSAVAVRGRRHITKLWDTHLRLNLDCNIHMETLLMVMPGLECHFCLQVVYTQWPWRFCSYLCVYRKRTLGDSKPVDLG